MTERPNDRRYFHLGEAMDRDQEIIDALNPPVPLVVIDTSDTDE